MKQADHYPRSRETYEPQFSDSDHQQNMRVDPLTTMDEIKTELSEIGEKQQNRIDEAKAAEDAKELEERKQYEAWKASQAELKNDTKKDEASVAK